ncbi:sulfotransferase family 2 domain-containing protein [Fodinicurvata sediminis]|uniref:sulfotransferase family 2 domain-containing protein n=1 Tax=Fodinicurvata sediminis TaxID=1121832 RepID=UPI0003B54920|nr:sulfotransferase family 2 domain-containing protein [Fodinicurvata sediminis]
MKSTKYKFRPYYLLRPRLWREHIKPIDLRTALSLEWGYGYIRIPKAANSTIIGTLQQNFPEARITSKRVGDIKKQYLHYSDLSLTQAITLPRRLFTFTIVRNPYSRALSAYLNKIAEDRMPEHKKHSAQIESYDEGRLSFRGFCRYLAEGGERDNPHWMRQTRILGIADRIDYLGKLESLDDDLPAIVRRISPAVDLTIQRKGQRTGASGKLHAYYDTECRQIVEAVYDRDFGELGYVKEL